MERTRTTVEVLHHRTTAAGERVAGFLVDTGRSIQSVDLDERWPHPWSCTCGRAPVCAHVRAAEGVVDELGGRADQ